jgi:arylsulfatase A-like enzyme
MCTSLDRAFGWLVDKLNEKSLTQDTIVVFTSDHGDTLYSHGFRHNKMRPEAESIRVPLLIRYPRRLKPRVSELLFGTLDFMPTLLGLMGLQAPDTCQGKDLSRAIAAGRDNEVDGIPLFLYAADWRGLYTRRYTYSFDTNRGEWSFYRESYFREPAGIEWNCLYDRERDPWELSNLYRSPVHRRLRGQMHEQTVSGMKRFDDDGLSRAAVARAAYTVEDLELERQHRRGSGVLRGKPVDLLRR